MAYYTERQRMEMRLLQCIVEPPVDGHAHTAATPTSSDVTLTSSDSDGDAPVIAVPHSSSSSPTSPPGQRHSTAADWRPRRRQPANTDAQPHTRRPWSGSHQSTSRSDVLTQAYNPNPNPNPHRKQYNNQTNASRNHSHCPSPYDTRATRSLTNPNSNPDPNRRRARRSNQYRTQTDPNSDHNPNPNRQLHRDQINPNHDPKTRLNPEPNRQHLRDRTTPNHDPNSHPNPNPNRQRQRPPGVDIVVDEDAERSRRTAWQRGGRNPPALRAATSQRYQDFGDARLAKKTYFQQPRFPDYGDERLAKKYFELRQMILDKLDLRTLTPQVRRQARQLVQKYYSQGSQPLAPGKFQRSMTLGNPPGESDVGGRGSRQVRERRVSVRETNAAGRSGQQDKRLNFTAAGDMERKKVTFVDDYTQQETTQECSRTWPVQRSQQVERSVAGDAMTSGKPHHHHPYQQQQEDRAETENHSDDSYSTEFSSESSSDDDEDRHAGETKKPNSPVDNKPVRSTTSEKRRDEYHVRPTSAPKSRNTKQADVGTTGSSGRPKSATWSSTYNKHSRTSSSPPRESGRLGTSPTRSVPASTPSREVTRTTPSGAGTPSKRSITHPLPPGYARRADTSPTRSRARQRQGRSKPHPASETTGGTFSEKSVTIQKRGSIGRTGYHSSQSRSRSEGRSKAQPEGHSSPDRQKGSKVKKEKKKTGCDEDGSGSSSSSSSDSGSGSPGRRRDGKSGSPSRGNPAAEYHLKYTDNDEIRQWLKSKNSMLRRDKRDKRRSERARRHELQEKELAKEERRRESEVLVKKWMDEKKTENRVLWKRQQQTSETLVHLGTDSKQSHEILRTGTDSKPTEDLDGHIDPELQENCTSKSSVETAETTEEQKKFTSKPFIGRRSVSKPAEDHSGKNSLSRKDAGETKVPLFSRLGKYDTFPGGSTWKSKGKEISHAERRKMYGDWLRNNRTASTEQVQNKPEEQEPKDLAKFEQQSSEKDRRCTSARVGRRTRGRGQAAVPRLDGVRPSSSTRLEPQGSDQLDPSPELDDNAQPEKKHFDEEKSTLSKESIRSHGAGRMRRSSELDDTVEPERKQHNEEKLTSSSESSLEVDDAAESDRKRSDEEMSTSSTKSKRSRGSADLLDRSPDLDDVTAEPRRKKHDEENSTSSSESTDADDEEKWTSSVESSPELDDTEEPDRKHHNLDEEKSTFSPKRKESEPTSGPECSSYIVPHVNVEFEDGIVSTLDPDISTPRARDDDPSKKPEGSKLFGIDAATEQEDSFGRYSAKKPEDPVLSAKNPEDSTVLRRGTRKKPEDSTLVGPRMHSGRDLMTLIQSESRFLLVDSEADSGSRCSSFRHLNLDNLESGEDKVQSEGHQEAEKEEDGRRTRTVMRLDVDVESVKSSSFLSVACDTDVSMGVREDVSMGQTEDERSERPDSSEDQGGGHEDTGRTYASSDDGATKVHQDKTRHEDTGRTHDSSDDDATRVHQDKNTGLTGHKHSDSSEDGGWVHKGKNSGHEDTGRTDDSSVDSAVREHQGKTTGHEEDTRRTDDSSEDGRRVQGKKKVEEEDDGDSVGSSISCSTADDDDDDIDYLLF